MRVEKCAVLRCIMIAVAIALSGCQKISDEENARALNRFREVCQKFAYISPEWKQAASDLRKKIKSGQIHPYLDISLRPGNGTSASQRSAGNLQDDIGKVTIDAYRIYERDRFLFEINMPVYHQPNPFFLCHPLLRQTSIARVSKGNPFMTIFKQG